MTVLMGGAVIAASLRSNFQPWYLLYLLPFASLISQKASVRLPVILLSMAGLCNYIPYLFSGNWDPPIPLILQSVNLTALGLSVLLFLVYLKKERKADKD